VRKALLLLALILCCSIALAQPSASPANSAPDLQTLHQAIFSPNADPQPKIALCSPPTNDVCPYKQCECLRYTCSRCGIKSFTCNEATGASTCVCKTC
jgi:hypothetical protein